MFKNHDLMLSTEYVVSPCHIRTFLSYSHFPLFIPCMFITAHNFCFKRLRAICLRVESLVRVRRNVWSSHHARKILAKIFLELAQVSLLTRKRPIKKHKSSKNVLVFATISFLILSIIQMVPL